MFRKRWEAALPNGTLTLVVHDTRSYLTIVPREQGQGPIFKRDYDYWQQARAEQDYQAILSAASLIEGGAA